jgi:transposase
MKPISMEKRELLIAAKTRGETEKDIAKWLDISKGSVGTIWRLFRKTGSFLPTPYPGRPSGLTSEKVKEIHATVENEPDITLSELIEKLSLPIKKSQLSRLLISHGYSFKKRQLIQQNKTVPTSKRNADNFWRTSKI